MPESPADEVWLLHGFAADRLSWLATLPALEGMTTVTPDLPGHGKSADAVGAGTPADLLRPLTARLSDRGAAPVHLVGHSLGGGLALMAAAERPERVASLFLIAPAGLGAGLDAAFLRELPDLADADAMRAHLEKTVVRSRLISRQTVDYALAQLARPGARDALRCIAEATLAAEPRFAEAADTVAAGPVRRIAVWGARDGVSRPDTARLEDFGPYRILPETAHLPHIEAPDEVNRLLRRFLRGEEATDDQA